MCRTGNVGRWTPRRPDPDPFLFGWRVFYTQQHGDNNTWEIEPSLGSLLNRVKLP
jgi:hypothetical protein